MGGYATGVARAAGLIRCVGAKANWLLVMATG